jgi:hypothetical protein
MATDRQHTVGPTSGVAVRDWVREFRRVPARELLANDGYHRQHPQAQRNALCGVREFGVVA